MKAVESAQFAVSTEKREFTMSSQVPPHRSSRKWRNGTAGLLFMALFALSAAPSRAAMTELIVSDQQGIALFSFDPVAFFVDHKARRGLPSLEFEHAGAVFRFRNPGNLAAFKSHPETYMPRYGGYDPIAIGRGAPASGFPTLFVIRKNLLYFFSTEKNRARFLANPQEAIAAAEVEWPHVKQGLVQH
jgi:YHS domain-containing protein